MSPYDETLHPRGQAANAGQFRAKANSAPAGLLDEPALTPGDVRTADFTADILRDHLAENGAERITETTDDGTTTLSWLQPTRYRDAPFHERALIDADGEIIARESSNGSGTWHRSDPFDDEMSALRQHVNDVRLAFAGVHIHGQPNDGGPYGRKFVGGKVATDGHSRYHDAAQVAADIRKQMKAAVEWGALPAKYEYGATSDKFSGGQAVRIRVSGMRDADHFAERQEGFAYGQSAKARELEAALETIGNQWNTDASDTQSDYFDVTYYLQVEIENEHTTAFREQQRIIARARRAARAAEKSRGAA